MSTKFVTDEKGKKIAAVVPIKRYEQLIEDLQDLEMVAQRRNDERIPYAEIKKKLIADGTLPN